jgi:hypothetical protein
VDDNTAAVLQALRIRWTPSELLASTFESRLPAVVRERPTDPSAYEAEAQRVLALDQSGQDQLLREILDANGEDWAGSRGTDVSGFAIHVPSMQSLETHQYARHRMAGMFLRSAINTVERLKGRRDDGWIMKGLTYHRVPGLSTPVVVLEATDEAGYRQRTVPPEVWLQVRDHILAEKRYIPILQGGMSALS